MVHYKDMTFCWDECGNMSCPRNKKLIQKGITLAVAFSSFKENCETYVKEVSDDGTRA